MSVFLEYDCAALDAQYFVRGYLPEWDDKIQEFKALSATRHAVGLCILICLMGIIPAKKWMCFYQKMSDQMPQFWSFSMEDIGA